jgi:glycosyltransferase involved in cell wall biosynthesis
MSRPKLLFLATEDWFVRSHFEHLLYRAQEEGYEVSVAARMSGALEHVAGVRLIDLPFARASRLGLWREAEAVRALLREERPALVHAIALRPIAALLLGPKLPCVFAITGRGYLALRRSPWAQAALAMVAAQVRQRVLDGDGVLLVENESDLDWVSAGAALPKHRVVLTPGAGVDVTHYDAAPAPEGPVVVGIAARLVRSKGVDVAIAALSRVRAAGLDIVLRVAGAPDAGNPDSVGGDELSRWRAEEGVELLGHVGDVNAFWARAHIACLPSRGGEGLPRSLLEAAACGRPIITTDTPGCADFVRRGEIGAVVDADNAAALAAALEKLAQDGELRLRLGAAARALVESHYTLAHAADAAASAWRSLGAAKARR